MGDKMMFKLQEYPGARLCLRLLSASAPGIHAPDSVRVASFTISDLQPLGLRCFAEFDDTRMQRTNVELGVARIDGACHFIFIPRAVSDETMFQTKCRAVLLNA